MKTFQLLLLVCAFASSALSQVNVPFDRIRHASDEPQNWLTFGGDYAGHRYSLLGQITPANVAMLKPVWVYQASDLNKFETSPIVLDGIVMSKSGSRRR